MRRDDAAAVLVAMAGLAVGVLGFAWLGGGGTAPPAAVPAPVGATAAAPIRLPPALAIAPLPPPMRPAPAASPATPSYTPPPASTSPPTVQPAPSAPRSDYGPVVVAPPQ